MIILHYLIWLFAGLVFLSSPGTAVATEAGAYPKTAIALHERYADEVIAHDKYGAFADHAFKEGYPAIAHLFRTLAYSEAVHAKNFARLLREMGQEPLMPAVVFNLTSTKELLQLAAAVEAAEIDKEYPAILQRISKEQNEPAMRFITYAWKAEQQHRDLIVQIKKAASWYFGMLVSKIEGSPTRYYVCQICGSTVMQMPGKQCPICDHPPEQYQEVPGFADSSAKPVSPRDGIDGILEHD